ncbi:MAG: hypothetical protein IKP64_07915 [Selenomonadaceae bacterium]|nr:hypothetical protein [Selenomonadaceae bacterium]MBR4383468.1 hypothetical protein [Selenomonadaceae bacterium]
MSTPQTKDNTQTRERPDYGEVTYAQYKDLQNRMDYVEKELDRVNVRMDRIENLMDKLDTKIDKLSDKIDALHNEIKSSANHGQIATISTIGIAIAVIYSLLR